MNEADPSVLPIRMSQDELWEKAVAVETGGSFWVGRQGLKLSTPQSYLQIRELPQTGILSHAARYKSHPLSKQWKANYEIRTCLMKARSAAKASTGGSAREENSELRRIIPTPQTKKRSGRSNGPLLPPPPPWLSASSRKARRE